MIILINKFLTIGSNITQSFCRNENTMHKYCLNLEKYSHAEYINLTESLSGLLYE